MRRLAAALILLPWTVWAQDAGFVPTLPAAARLTAEDREEATTLALPSGPWSEAGLPTVTAGGDVRRRAWRIPGLRTVPQLLAEQAAAAAAQGYAPVFSCATDACGGFDFRYALPLLPEPDMHVDLGRFRHLTARHPDGGLLGITASRGGGAGFVHVIESRPPGPPAVAASERTEAPAAAAGSDATGPDAGPSAGPVPVDTAVPVVLRMDREGRVALDDLRFDPGSADLADGPFASLAALAEWMADRPAAQVALVGHSDASGALAANLLVSRRRAEAVRARLLSAHGADAARLSAEGAAYLAPRATNATEAGRALNRRVEAVRVDGG